MATGVIVTFDGGGADTVEPASKFIEYPALMYGDLAVATRAGYIFDGWFLNPNEDAIEVFAESEVQSWSGHTLYAHWVKACTVTLDGNGGGTPSPSSLVVAVGGSYGTALTNAVVTREGYVFAGWASAASGGTIITSGSPLVSQLDHTLYAHWAELFTATLDGNGGSTPDPATLEVLAGDLYGVALTNVVVTREGYAFVGWRTGASSGDLVNASSVVPASDHTLYAWWVETITVTLNGNGGGAVSPPSFAVSGPGAYGDSLTSAVVTREGYAFTGWYTAAIGGTLVTAASSPAVWESHTLYAGWDCEYFKLTEDGLWVYIDPAIVGKNLPPGLQAWFDLWLTAGGRAERLVFVVRGVVADFRTATAADQDAVGALDDSLVKAGLLTVVKSTIWYNLAIECGYANAATFVAAWGDAQVYLRRLMIDLRLGNNIHGSGSGKPLYGAPNRASRSSGRGGSTIGVPNVGSSGGSSYSGPINMGMGMG